MSCRIWHTSLRLADLKRVKKLGLRQNRYKIRPDVAHTQSAGRGFGLDSSMNVVLPNTVGDPVCSTEHTRVQIRKTQASMF